MAERKRKDKEVPEIKEEINEVVIQPIENVDLPVEAPVPPIFEDVAYSTELKEKMKEALPEIPKMPPMIRWKKIGNGAFVLNNRYIKPGQIFSASEAEIPKAFRDVVIPLDSIPESKGVEEASKPNEYSIVKVGEPDDWNIVDKRGKKLNEMPLSYGEALKIKEIL